MSLSVPDLPAVSATLIPPVRDLGDGFTVRRALPSPKVPGGSRMVGPFIFFDQMGPAALAADHVLDVRPHPHINLATLTYLLDGQIMHRDSLGSLQEIRPGEVNWMTAGRGIVHSERSPDAVRQNGGGLFGLQTWLALPTAHEEVAPEFFHYDSASIPVLSDKGVNLTLVAGSSEGLASPVKTYSDLIYADLTLAAGARHRFSAEHVERAIYVISGELQVVGQEGSFGPSQMVILRPDAEVVLTSATGLRAILLGGEPFPEERFIYWNFVSSRKERIEQAKEDWRAGRFAAVPGETEFIPLPPEPGQ